MTKINWFNDFANGFVISALNKGQIGMVFIIAEFFFEEGMYCLKITNDSMYGFIHGFFISIFRKAMPYKIVK